MNQELSPAEVVDWAALQGDLITERQLKRWWNANLIPRPRTPGRGRARGRAVVLSASVLPQLEALRKHQRDRVRSFPLLRVRLWIEGFDVPWGVIQQDMAKQLSGPLPNLSEVSDEEIAKHARNIRRSRARGEHVSDIPTPDIESAVNILVSAAISGRLQYDLGDPVDAPPTGYRVDGSTLGDRVTELIGLDARADKDRMIHVLHAVDEHRGLSILRIKKRISDSDEQAALAARTVLKASLDSQWLVSVLDRSDFMLITGLLGSILEAQHNRGIMESITSIP